MSTSFGECEALQGAAENAFWSNLWEQAAAEGITALVSSGDDGAAGCDDQGAGSLASQGMAVSGVASTPYDTAVGGTEFNEAAGPGPYWSTSTTSFVTALGYIPEAVWNESSAASGNISLWAGSGGASSIYAKPPWQAGAGVPADQHRDLPDVALTAAGHDGYVICENNSCANNGGGFSFYVASGTSAASPSWAGIMALVDQTQGGPVGLANPVLYRLATSAGVFHDVTAGNNDVPCTVGTPDCPSGTPNPTFGYNAGPGFDLATGWGSPNIANLLQEWGSVKFAASTTTLQLTLPQNLTYGQGVPVAIQVTAANGGPIPTGEVVLLAQQSDGSESEIQTFPISDSGSVNVSSVILPAGSYSVAARYSGDTNYGASSSPPVPATVGKATPTLQIQLLEVSAQGAATPMKQAAFGNTVEAIVTVNGPAAGAAPTGAVVLNPTAPTTQLPLWVASETVKTSLTAIFQDNPWTDPGTYGFTVAYPGDLHYAAITAPATMIIVQAPTTLTIVGLAPNSAINVELDAATPRFSPQLQVNVLVNGAIAATGNPHSSTPDPVTGDAEMSILARFLNPLPGKTTTYVAQFAGNQDYLASTSAPFTGPTPPDPIFSPSALDFGVVAQGASITKTSILTNAGGMALQMGVQILGNAGFTQHNDCGSTLALDASCTVNLTFQPIALETAYSGNLYAGPGSDPSAQGWGKLPFTAAAPGFIFHAQSISAVYGVGAPAVFQLQLTTINGLSGPVALSCSQLPAFSSCSFSPAAPEMDGTNPVNVTLTVAETPIPLSASAPPSWPRQWPWGLIVLGIGGAVLALCLPTVPDRRVAVLLASVILLAACGGGGGAAAPPPPVNGGSGGGGSGGGSTSSNPLPFPQLEVSPAAIDFGSVSVGQTATRNVTVTNGGNAPLTGIGFGFQEHFNYFSTTSRCANLSPGGQCQAAVSFRPSLGEQESASLFVLASGQEKEVNLSGTGVLTQLQSGSYPVDVTAEVGGVSQVIVLELNVP